MSGTRSHSPPEPATRPGSRALLIAAHGDTGGVGGNVLAQELARRVRQTRIFEEVVVGFLRGKPSLEEAAALITCDRIHIYPLFLSDGYYVREALPKRLTIKDGVDALGRRVTIDEPLGVDPRLPELLAGAVACAARVAGMQTGSCTVLLVAHGSSKSPESAEAAYRVREGILQDGKFASVEVAFLEEEPFFGEALKNVRRPALVLGLFAGTGMHATDDVSAAVAKLGDPQIVAVEQLGGYASIIELIAAELARR